MTTASDPQREHPQEPHQLYGATIIPPAVGMVPKPPAEILSALDVLEVIHAGPRAARDQLRAGLAMALRRTAAVLAGQRFRPRAHGLSDREAEQWARQAAQLLAPATRSQLVAYVRACQEWTRALHRTIGSNEADQDRDSTSGRRVEPGAPEARLAQSLEAVGIPIRARVGVANERGGRLRGGWYDAFWLDCVHRDAAYLLGVDIELEGRHHYRPERQAHHQILADRGWYVVRLSGRIVGQTQHRQALDQLVALVERHRRAVVLGRSDLSRLAQMLAASRPGAWM